MRRHHVRPAIAVAALLISAGCARKQEQRAQIQTVPVERRDIVVDVEATGVVEPINVVEVKSKASGQIVRMPVETGSTVKPGDLLVQLDTRDVRNQYDQALADVRAAQARLEVSTAQKKRADDLHGQSIITSQEHETATLDHANAQAALVRARTSLDLAQQRLEDATVRAPITGTVIEKLVSLGQVIASATGTLGGGTTLLRMADLDQVRVRALVVETDIGGVEPGQTTTVTVDAYPERQFRGVVEKIEPQAVVQQSVTMFPVLITIQNLEGLLKPGMNGEVAILVERRENVLAVPNDAVRSPREAMAAATALGLDPETVRAALQAQRGGGPGSAGAAPAGGGAGGRQVFTSPGDVMLAASDAAAGAQEPQQRQQVQVTDAQCTVVREAMAKKPEAREQIAALMARMRNQEIDREAAREEMQKIYGALGVDARVARACQMRERGGEARRGDGSSRSAGAAAVPAASGGTPAQRAPDGPLLTTPETPSAPQRRGRMGLVFVADSARYTPRMVMLGVGNYDYTEVLRGVSEGEEVVLLSAAALQMQRQEFQDRIRSRASIPGLQREGTSSGSRAGGGARPR